MSQDIEARFGPGALEALRSAIADAAGQEVFCLGRLDDENRIDALSVAARGNEAAVPAITADVEGWDVVLHNHPSGVLRPSAPDLAVASRLGNEGIGFYIVDNEVEHVYVVVEPVRKRELRPVDGESLAALLGPGGRLEQTMEGYENREPQIDLLRSVVDCLNHDRIGAFEAGTGVGKSLAYLVPAMAWLARNPERIIVSTGTINLQQQLVEKDLPLVRELLRSGVRAELVKGRQNYLCLTRLEEGLAELTLFDEGKEELEALRAWAASTPTGSRSDLPFQPADDVWSEVCSEADTCRGAACGARGQCFFLRARRAAASAQLLVVNHHLLFADLSIRLSGLGFDAAAVLPPAQRLILDEAHNIETAASSYFSSVFSRGSVRRSLRRLHRSHRGGAAGLAHRVPGLDAPTIVGLVAAVEDRAETANALSLELLGAEGSFHLEARSAEAERLLLSPLVDLAGAVVELAGALERGIAELDPTDAGVQETRTVARRLRGAADVCGLFRRFEEHPDTVFWLESTRARGSDRTVRYTATPLDISSFMREAVFTPYPTVIFTSATLTVGKAFDFWTGRIGLHDDASGRYVFGIHPSPFNFRDNVLLCVPQDVPAPTDPRYLDAAAEIVARAVEVSEGGALVLFTSYSALAHVHDRTRERIEGRGIPVLKQGDDDRFRLLARFREEGSAVLFATTSFWEGVDAPGDALRLLIVCRLPFRVPTDPVVKARVAAIEAAGGNAFADYSLPDAVMKLRQGFGRLIRSATDRGVVLVLDSRLVSKPYGAVFLDSLPETGRCVSDTESVLEQMERFYY
jgi:ATP-dependent DNA helicase DinG